MEESHIPQAVKDAFAKRFPGVTVEGWEMDAQYEAEFTNNGKEVEVTFDAEGSITQIEYEIEVEDLPVNVKNSIMSTYPYCEIEEAERVEKPDGTILYEVSLSFEVHMTAEGKLAAIGKDL